MNLKDLKYVCEHAGGGLVPALAMLHVYERDGARRAQVGNGRYTVDVPTDLPVCTVPADRLLTAWAACKDTPEATVTDANLMVKAGRVRARVPLSDSGSYPRTDPNEQADAPPPGVAKVLSRLQPFVATDASRPWATSVCLKGGFAYATNNVILMRIPFPAFLPFPVNVPQVVIDAITAKGEPVGLGWSQDAVTFYFEDTTWIRTLLISGDWPTQVVDGLVDGLSEAWETPHPDLGAMLTTASKLADARHPVIEFKDGGLRLLDAAFEADELMPVPEAGKINARMGALVFSQATAVQWHTPRQDVHAFKVEDIVGVFGGQR